MTSLALISVKASLTRMTPLLAAGCGALRVTLLSVEPEHEWAVREELPLFSSSRSVGCGLGGSDPLSTSSSKLPVASGGDARTLTDRALLCAGAIGLLGISSGCRHPAAGGSFFFRPTPYGFRQVVQHVSKHVANEIN